MAELHTSNRRASLLLGTLVFCVTAIAALPGDAETSSTSTPAPTTTEAPTSTETPSSTEAPATGSVTTEAPATEAPAPTGSPAASTSAQPSPEQEQAAVAKARQVDTANAKLGDVTRALAILQQEVGAQSVRVDLAAKELEAANARVAGADSALADLEEKVATLEGNAADQAIESFKGGSLENTVLVGEDPNEAIRRQTMLSKATRSDIDYAAELAGIQEDRRRHQADAQRAAADAEKLQAEATQELQTLEKDQADQAAVVGGAAQRLDHLLSEKAALAELGFDAPLESGAEDALVQQLASAPTPAPPAKDTSIPPVADTGEMVAVGKGIEVHSSIAPQIRQLLADADAANVNLAGGGYRSPAAQIRTRKANCGTSNYAIYEMRASSCSPPTARPGRSMHEQGKAIDFTYNGNLIRSRSGGGWNWLKANASKYGLQNLPSEPWHWSVNGR